MNSRSGTTVLFGLILLLLSPTTPAQELSEEELERWFESDEMVIPYEDKGGDETLHFIHPPPEEAVPRSHTRLRFDGQTPASGWVAIEQCHEGLDAVPDAEVVYRFKQMRQLTITEAGGIEKAWTDGQGVQLKNVGKEARLCVALQARLLHKIGDGRYQMQYGPFQRRFLDSYFPMHVSLELDYTDSGLIFESISPEPTEGFVVVERDKHLEIDAWFRGKLLLELFYQSMESR